MVKPSTAELRREPRLRLIERRLPGALEHADGEPIFAIAIDVSRRGLGIVTTNTLPRGTRLVLRIENGKTIGLEVTWSRQTRDRATLHYRCGLRVLDADVDLTILFFAAGVLDYDLDDPKYP